MMKRLVKCSGLIVLLAGAALAAPAGSATAASHIQAVAQASSIVTLPLPRISDYWMSATRQSGGVIVFDGYAPDAATRERFSQIPDADTNFLKLGSGAPSLYQPAVGFGLSLLERLSEGRFALRDNTITLTGIAGSTADYDALAELIAAGPPPGLVLAHSEIKAPPASPYLLSATKTHDGSVSLTGMLPDPAAKASLAAAAGHPSVTAITYASGEPASLITSASAALSLLQWLDTGAAAFNGTAWTVSGTAINATNKAAIEATFATRKLAAAGWTLDIDVAAAPAVVTAPPKPPVDTAKPTTPVAKPAATEPATPVTAPVAPEKQVAEPTTPAIDPTYTFSASRGVGGAVTLSGQLPADPALRFFSVITGAPTTGVTIADGAPDDFILSAEAGLRALMELENGQLRFATGKWSLTGKAQTNAARDAVAASIAALPKGADWTVSVTAPPPLDACQASVAAFSARNAILFRSGSAVLAPESEAALDELAGDLALCPAADVDVEGHTDADGEDQLNLALSVARAEAVVDALITRHIAPGRLYAVGYGESQPIADNDTSAGKRLNRRIVIKVLEHHMD